ncbi:EAL domain-containing protein [Massilia horti]|uniref:EAL domain-containing protein n=1 Tax=Massilia horti TaxID=2562153 RepID=A0A4Y9TA96_9BURK|nr:EAL domain-containing protein [Massilia horti]TFW35348.1 EAL domain-containing protein [Massilia horti]
MQQEQETVDILVVEDSPTQACQLAHLLAEQGGYTVRVAANGAEGLAAAREATPTLIVSDIKMPVMDGFELCREIKGDPALRDVPVILLTSLTSLYDVIRGLDCGADNFIRKPFDSKYLLGRVRFILANRALRRDERVQLGMQVTLSGQTHFITAERQQIFDLLIATYEEAIQLTEELKAQQARTERSYQTLEGLYKITEALNPALTERAVAEAALERVLDFPGVAGGCLALVDDQGVLRVAALQAAGSDAPAPGAQLDCDCARRLLDGTLRAPEVLHGCQALGGTHACVPLLSGERALGLLHLRTGPEPLDADQLHVLGTIGNQIAIAIGRAHLYGRMESLVRSRTEALASERNLLSAVVETSGALVALCAPSGQIVLYNRACEMALGWPADEALGRPAWEVFRMAGDDHAVRRFFQGHPSERMPLQMGGQWLARDGAARSVIWSGTGLARADGSLEYVLFSGLDTTELRGAEERLEYVSKFDVLTGLPNRILLGERVHQLSSQARVAGQVLGLMLLRLDRQYLVRETLGLDAEKALLQQIAQRLLQPGGADFVARFSDATFALLAVRSEPARLADAAQAVLRVFDTPFVLEQEELHLEGMVGIAVFPNDGAEFEDLVRAAEAALRGAANSREQRFEFYRPELNRGASERFKLEGALRRALERSEFELHYQPQVALGSGAIIGVEALLRWRHPERGLLGPGAFIELAEETGLILPIGEWVLRRACEQTRAWQQNGVPVVPVSVNLSARQFAEHIPETVRRILDETGLDPALLELELTESASMDDPKRTFEILRRLKEMGVSLAIDDFGTGYSSLNYLKRFPVDKLKLDQSFVREIVSDPHDLSIARAVIALGHGLRLTVIAEGVESAAQLALLARHGCDEMQGYFFSRPVPASECARLLCDGVALSVDAMRPAPGRRTVLYVEANAELRDARRRALAERGYDVLGAADAKEAFELLALAEVGVVLCAEQAGDLPSTELLARVGSMYPEVVRILLVSGTAPRNAPFWCLAEPAADGVLGDALDEAFSAANAAGAVTRRYNRS